MLPAPLNPGLAFPSPSLVAAWGDQPSPKTLNEFRGAFMGTPPHDHRHPVAPQPCAESPQCPPLTPPAQPPGTAAPNVHGWRAATPADLGAIVLDIDAQYRAAKASGEWPSVLA